MNCKFNNCTKPAEFGVDQIGTEYEMFSKTGLTALCKEHFDDGFWLEAIADADGVIVNGDHYRISDASGFSKGHGGRKFVIQFNDGRIVETNNLWSQGKISEKYRDRLPDNAIFVKQVF